MARVIDSKIPNLDTSWENYTGERVEEFIKQNFKDVDALKFGYLTIEKGVGGLQTMRFLQVKKRILNGSLIRQDTLTTF